MNASPSWLTHAQKLVGLKEIVGSKHESKVLQFFAEAGHPEVYDDETAWCAAFVNAMLRRAGYAGTGSLAARSFLTLGDKLDKPVVGCIAVFKRGKSAWQGHVAFFLRSVGNKIEVLGGNQGNAVSKALYPKNALLGYRWPTVKTTSASSTADLISDISSARRIADAPGSAGVNTAEGPMSGKPNTITLALQKQLNTMAYFVGEEDGVWGGKTKGAIAAFKGDRGLGGEALIDAPLLAEIEKAFSENFTRPIADERKFATAADLAPKLPEVKAAQTAQNTSWWAALTGMIATVWTAIVGGLSDAIEMLNPVKEFVTGIPWYGWVGIVGVASVGIGFISKKAGDAKNASTGAYNEGSRI